MSEMKRRDAVSKYTRQYTKLPSEFYCHIQHTIYALMQKREKNKIKQDFLF